MPTFAIDPADPQGWEPALAAAVGALAAGAPVIVPTETVYGIAARPDVPGATARLFALKRRPEGLNLPVLAATAAEALSLAEPRESAAARLAGALWPGPLTLVLPRSRRSSAWHLGEDGGTIGVRVPSHRLALALLRRTGPLAVTSANLSGQAPLTAPDDLTGTFGDDVAVYILSGPAPGTGLASTVVDLTGSAPAILRDGPIERERILALASVEGSPPGGPGAG